MPPQPTEGNRLPLGSQGQWIDVDMVDPRTHQAHLGYAHELAANTTVAVDYTHVEGRNEKRQMNVNFNTANFGSAYNGNGRSPAFRTPTGYIPSIGYPRQVQLGARFLF